MDWISENYDLVLVDRPAILAVTDLAIVGAHADTAMIVTRLCLSTIKEIEATSAKHRFEEKDIDV